MKYNLDFKNQARVVKFEIMDAIDTRIKKIKKKFQVINLGGHFEFQAQNCQIEFFCYRNSKNKLLPSNII